MASSCEGHNSDYGYYLTEREREGEGERERERGRERERDILNIAICYSSFHSTHSLDIGLIIIRASLSSLKGLYLGPHVVKPCSKI